MSKLRITPINMLMAIMLTWVLWQLMDQTLAWSQALWMLVLFVILVITDQFFRNLIKNLRKIWLIEGAFIILVLSITWIVSIW